jgi:hypothetical protein
MVGTSLATGARVPRTSLIGPRQRKVSLWMATALHVLMKWRDAPSEPAAPIARRDGDNVVQLTA